MSEPSGTDYGRIKPGHIKATTPPVVVATRPKDDGRPAFPLQGFAAPNGTFEWPQPGMTLRQYYAGQALPAVIRACAGDPLSQWKGAQSIEEYFAQASVRCADELIRALDK